MAKPRPARQEPGFTVKRIGAMLTLLVMSAGVAWLSVYTLLSRPLDEITSRGVSVGFTGWGGLASAAGLFVLLVVGFVRALRGAKHGQSTPPR